VVRLLTPDSGMQIMATVAFERLFASSFLFMSVLAWVLGHV